MKFNQLSFCSAFLKPFLLGILTCTCSLYLGAQDVIITAAEAGKDGGGTSSSTLSDSGFLCMAPGTIDTFSIQVLSIPTAANNIRISAHLVSYEPDTGYFQRMIWEAFYNPTSPATGSSASFLTVIGLGSVDGTSTLNMELEIDLSHLTTPPANFPTSAQLQIRLVANNIPDGFDYTYTAMDSFNRALIIPFCLDPDCDECEGLGPCGDDSQTIGAGDGPSEPGDPVYPAEVEQLKMYLYIAIAIIIFLLLFLLLRRRRS